MKIANLCFVSLIVPIVQAEPISLTITAIAGLITAISGLMGTAVYMADITKRGGGGGIIVGGGELNVTRQKRGIKFPSKKIKKVASSFGNFWIIFHYKHLIF